MIEKYGEMSYNDIQGWRHIHIKDNVFISSCNEHIYEDQSGQLSLNEAYDCYKTWIKKNFNTISLSKPQFKRLMEYNYGIQIKE